MEVFQIIAIAFESMYNILDKPISLLGGLSIMRIGIALTSVMMVKRFLLDPLFNRNAIARIDGGKASETKNKNRSDRRQNRG